MRRISALVVAATLLAALTACTGAAGAGNCDSGITGGNASDAVKSTGKFGAAPEVTFPTPLITESIETTTLIEGNSTPLRDGQPVIIEATILNGTDGSVLQQTTYETDGGSLFTIGQQALPGLAKALECTTVGSRVAIVTSAEDNATPEAPATSEDSIVFVVDVIRAYKARADGADQLPLAGMPSVVTAPGGAPGITVPNEEAPSELETAVLKLGSGTTVKDNDPVVVKSTAVDWDTKEVSESTWTTGSTSVLDLGAAEMSEGLREAVAGQKVGSQVLAVVPAAEGGTATVYVIDILGIIN